MIWVMKAESAWPCSNPVVSLLLHQICVPFLSFHGETGNCQRGTGPVFLFIELKVSGMTGITDAVYLPSAVQQEQLGALNSPTPLTSSSGLPLPLTRVSCCRNPGKEVLAMPAGGTRQDSCVDRDHTSGSKI